ncbi:RNI-like protein [Mycena alexandri]|uniref:RNI-like protein n=1 Tax=Mycena alexandri TaxID=1745969 RepID=A0AAD6SE44_9AGAR|nr:RNI-like protein [Mycena alexandri]
MSLHSPSLGPSSPSPSSSAVTIPIPGRSILKKPPPAQTGLLSRIGLGSFLRSASTPSSSAPTAQPPAEYAGAPASGGGKEKDESTRILKRAHFILPEIAVVYPISSAAPPSTPTLREEKRAIEERERERRRRVVRSNPQGGGGGGEESTWWSMDKVESFYRECCEGCQEVPDKGICAAFKNTPPTHPRAVYFSGVQLTPASAAVLADVVWRECDLEEGTLKPLLHALLIPRSLEVLSLAANRRLKGGAWRVLGAYLGKAHTLTFLDLSSNTLDKKAVECIVGALVERCVRAASCLPLNELIILTKMWLCAARAVRTSTLRNISLRHNKISPTGAVALALMIRDYPDVLATPAASSSSPGSSAFLANSYSHAHAHNGSVPPSPTLAAHHLDHLREHHRPQTHSGGGSGSASPVLPTGPSSGIGLGLGGLGALNSSLAAHSHSQQQGGKPPPPPRHPAQTITAAQTTYTPYVPRRRQQSTNANAGAGLGVGAGAAPPGRAVVASSVLGGVTARHVPSSPASSVYGGVDREREAREAKEREAAARERERDGPSAALLDKVRALDALPRVGALRTLDLRGNDLRTGITYIAQVLKRNRTLKVLNLAENKLDVACLVSLAEALKYNSSLETLDLSRNPCSGPGLEGIQSLRTAFTLNTALKRLFLSATGMGSPGAIALAEFLPESASLLHLDLTENALGVAGVLALSKGIAANFVMRCLDLNIPPGDEEFARMCRDILNATGVNGSAGGGLSSLGSGRGQGRGVWGMIEESELAKSIRLDEEKKNDADVVVRARACAAVLESMLAPAPVAPAAPAPGSAHPPSPADALKQAKALTRELGTVIQATEDPSRMEELLDVNDVLTGLVAQVPPPGRPTLTLQGLGLKWTPGAMVASPALENGDAGAGNAAGANGHAGTGEDEQPTTPRVDKGKARAVPEPEEPEKVLSPTLLMDDDDDERMRFSPVEGEDGEDDGETCVSRSWVEEEGEVFRKGTVLLGPEEMEGEYAGEDLRIELLEAMVERPPPRPLTDQFGIEIIQQQEQPQQQQQQQQQDTPEPTSPVVDKPPPRPYISRSRSSSNSIMSMISPTLASFTSAGQSPIPEGGQQGSPRIPSSPALPSPLGAGARPYMPRTRSSSSALDNR